MTNQLSLDLAKHLQSKVMQNAIDCTDVQFDLNTVEVCAILLSGAVVLIKMAASLHAAVHGAVDATEAFNNHESYNFMLNTIIEGRPATNG